MSLPNDTNALLIVLGAVFLLIGLLGGGFELSALRIPPVTRYVRSVAAVIGIAFLTVGIFPGLISKTPPERSKPSTAASGPKPPPPKHSEPKAPGTPPRPFPDPDVTYQIASAFAPNNVVTESPASPFNLVIQAPFSGDNKQRWHIVSLTGASAGYYHIISVASGLCLNVLASSLADGGRLITYACQDGYDNDKWGVSGAADGSYVLRAKHSGKVMDVNGSSTAPGVPLQQWTMLGGPNQHWRLLPAGP